MQESDLTVQFIAENVPQVFVRSENPAVYDTKGRMVQPKSRRVSAEFKRGTAPGYAREIGLKAFSFNGLPDSGISPEQWISFYDSVQGQQQYGWTDEEREAIEEKLLAQGYLRVEPTRRKAPWPAYDKLVAQGARTIEKVVAKIAEKVVEDGYDADEVIAYEAENLNRAAVIEALSELLAPTPEEELISA